MLDMMHLHIFSEIFLLGAKTYFAYINIIIKWMSSISVETNNEKQLTVDEYVRYMMIRDHIQQILDNSNIQETLKDAEDSINGLSVDVTIKYSVNKKKY